MKLKKKETTPNTGMGMIKVGDALGPLMEGPVPESHDDYDDRYEGSWANMTCWMKGSKRRPADPRLLLSILGCPLAPVAICLEPFSALSIKDVPIEASSAQYIVQQYVAATAAMKFQSSIQNSYAMGKMKVSQHEAVTKLFKVPIKSADINGWFTMWRMMPNKWHMELSLQECMIQAGCDGELMWHCTPWLGAHAVKGPVRPLMKALQGLDPLTTANIFGNARCVGEKKVGDEDCFVLKLSADPSMLREKRNGASEVIRHTLLGFFSQRTGLLVYLQDAYLTRVHDASGAGTVFWETTIESTLKDYRAVDHGVTLSHTGQSVVTLSRYGDGAASHTQTRVEETWSIEEFAFNVPGLSQEFFLAPADVCSH